MTDRHLIIPTSMQPIVERAGYVPAVKVGKTLYCAGQVGRTENLEVITDPEAQFIAAWESLRLVLEEGGCTFEDVVDMTTYHVNLSEHMAVFRDVKNRLFPRGRQRPCVACGAASEGNPTGNSASFGSTTGTWLPLFFLSIPSPSSAPRMRGASPSAAHTAASVPRATHWLRGRWSACSTTQVISRRAWAN